MIMGQILAIKITLDPKKSDSPDCKCIFYFNILVIYAHQTRKQHISD